MSRDWIAAIDTDEKPAASRTRERLDTNDWWERLGEAGWYILRGPIGHRAFTSTANSRERERSDLRNRWQQ